MPIRPGVRVTIDRVKEVSKAVADLGSEKVMIGVPSDRALRDNTTPINNAALAYIHEHGAPEAHIPSRPFLKPTIAAKQKTVIQPTLLKIGEAAFSGDRGKMDRLKTQLGQTLADAVRATIRAGISPPLKESTLIGRATRRATYKKAKSGKRKAIRQKAVQEGGIPLIDTGQLLRSITWVVRKMKR